MAQQLCSFAGTELTEPFPHGSDRAQVTMVVAREAIDESFFYQRVCELGMRPATQQHAPVGLNHGPRGAPGSHVRCGALMIAIGMRDNWHDAAVA